MVDDHRTRVGHSASVGHTPASIRLQCTVGADSAGQDHTGRVNTLPRVDQVDVLRAGVDVAELFSIRDDGGILGQRQLSRAVGVYKYTLRRIVEVSGLSVFNGVDKRPTGYQEEIDRRAANRKIGEVGAGGILHLLIGNQRKSARVAINVEGGDVSPDAACIQNIDKLTRSGHQYLCGVNPARAIRGVLRRCQLAKVVINSEAGNLLVLSAGHVEVTDCVIRTAGGHSKSQSEGHYKGQTNLAEFPELHAFPSSPSPCGLGLPLQLNC